MSDFGNTPFPRAPLVGAALLIGLVLVAATMTRVTGLGASKVPVTEVVAQRDFRFEDRDDGSIAVIDAAQNRVVDAVAPGTNGFLRGTLRGLVRERKRQGIGPETAFHLVGHNDGRLTLEDPTTGRHIELESFGPTNSAVFARLMTVGQPGTAGITSGSAAGKIASAAR